MKRPELIQDFAATQASFRVGHQVGDIVRKIYDPESISVLIDPQKDGFDAAFAKMADLLGSFKPIFEAALTTGDALAWADIMLLLNKTGKHRWRLIEVKSSTKVKDYHRDDVAVQAYIAKKTGVALERIDVACIDNQWIYPGNKNYQGLLKTTDLTDETFSRNAEAKKWLADAQQVVAKSTAPKVSTGSHCTDPYACGFYAYCRNSEPQAKYPVGWLPDIRKKALINEEGVADLRGVPDEM